MLFEVGLQVSKQTKATADRGKSNDGGDLYSSRLLHVLLTSGSIPKCPGDQLTSKTPALRCAIDEDMFSLLQCRVQKGIGGGAHQNPEGGYTENQKKTVNSKSKIKEIVVSALKSKQVRVCAFQMS